MRNLLNARTRSGTPRIGFLRGLTSGQRLVVALLLGAAAAGTGAFINAAGASANVTPATGGVNISMDKTSATGGSGTWTSLTGPVVTEKADADISVGTVTLRAPNGFEFRTVPLGGAVSVTIGDTTTNAEKVATTSAACPGGSSASASVAATTISVAVCQSSSNRLKSTMTWNGIEVRPTAATMLPTGDIVLTSGTISGVSGTTNFGTLSTTAGAAKKLAFTTQPGGGAADSAWSTQPVVTVQDNWGNTDTANSSASVTLAISSQPGGTTNTLSCTTNPLNASAGVETFGGCRIGGTAGSYTLSASSTGLTAATSGSFSITFGAAIKLAFTTQPAGPATGGTAFTTQPAVTVQDRYGNTVANNTSAVSLSITSGTGTAGAILSCTTNPTAASSGVATFSGCAIDKAGSGYQLHAIDGILTVADSASFSVTVGSPSKLGFAQQPASATAGNSISPAVTIRILDAGGNLTSSTASVTIAIGTNPGGGTLSGTLTSTAVSGTATFSTLSIDKAGTGYTLGAASSGLTSATSTGFNITAAGPSKLAFTQQPSNTTAGVAISPAVTVQIQDQFGNLTTDTSSVTVALGVNPGSATLTGTLTRAASGGVATFSNLSMTKAAAGYTLTAADGALTGATSGSFSIVATAASQVVIVQQPTDTAVTVSMSPAVTVQLRDQYGNNTAGTGISVTLTPSAGVINAGASATTAGGLATFGGITINNATTGLALTASSTGLTPSSASTSFTVYVPVSNGATLTNTIGDTASGVASVSYYYCAGFTGTCTAGNWVAIGTSTTPTTFSKTWTGQPTNGQYRLVAIGTDKVGNTSGASSSIPVVVSN